jgi:16S rRNA G966 N2-methylase RsmD
MCGLVEANLDLCRVPEDQTEVVNMTAEDFLKQSHRSNLEAWDIIFFDPPYAHDYVDVLKLISEHELLTKDGLLIAEHHHKKELPANVAALKLTRVLKQSDSTLSFYESR